MVRVERSGRGSRGGLEAVNGAVGSRNAGSKASPGMNGMGNVFGVDLNSLCPSSQNSAYVRQSGVRGERRQTLYRGGGRRQ